jgi:uncharacterized protein YkwD
MDRTTRILAVAVTGLLAAVVTAFALTPASAEAGRHHDAAARMYGLVDEARAEHGLPPLRPADDLADVAAAWSARMATADELEHNPDHADEICCWSSVAENVAWSEPPRTRLTSDPVARVVDELHAALLASPGHRENLLAQDLDEIGIGVHVDHDGSVWITQNFRTPSR